MAAKPQPPTTPVGEQASVAAIEHAATATKPVFDWSALAPSVAAPSKPVTINAKVDVLTEIPEPIRIRAELSLAKTVARIKAKQGSTAQRVRIEPAWQIQPVADAAMGAEFVKLITRYCKYRPADKPVPHADSDSPKGQVTVRCGEPIRYALTDDGLLPAKEQNTTAGNWGVRYAVKPFETRKGAARLPGTT